LGATHEQIQTAIWKHKTLSTAVRDRSSVIPGFVLRVLKEPIARGAPRVLWQRHHRFFRIPCVHLLPSNSMSFSRQLDNRQKESYVEKSQHKSLFG
jgi:hypothetical protein